MFADLFDSPWKILIVAIVIIVLFGSRKLPDAARSLGKSMRILKTEVQGLHEDNETVIKERIFLDKEKPDLLHDEITVMDHALTHPWTVTKSYRRERNAVWLPNECAEDNRHVIIGKEHYFISADGLLMPAKKDQPPPDLRYFRQSKK